jgi:hypothetical protein
MELVIYENLFRFDYTPILHGEKYRLRYPRVNQKGIGDIYIFQSTPVTERQGAEGVTLLPKERGEAVVPVYNYKFTISKDSDDGNWYRSVMTKITYARCETFLCTFEACCYVIEHVSGAALDYGF